jgi:hypothetical protein
MGRSDFEFDTGVMHVVRRMDHLIPQHQSIRFDGEFGTPACGWFMSRGERLLRMGVSLVIYATKVLYHNVC